MKARGIIFMAACAVFFLLVGHAGAENALYTCNVTQAGPSDSEVRIMLTDAAATPAFKSKWFKAPKGQENRMLAVAMAALINKKKVSALLDPSVQGVSEIGALYLKP